jgi:HEAT repeat protein
LSHFIDETPKDSDGAAVAAMLAHYLAEIRASDEDYENITFLTKNLVASVAQRHGKVKSQQELDLWIERLNLNDDALLLKRMAQILDVVVDGQWWYDRDTLRERLPE